MSGYLLDTNHLSKSHPARINNQRSAFAGSSKGIKIGTCGPVLCEMEAGLLLHPRPEPLRRTFRTLRSKISLWPIDDRVAKIYGEIYVEVRRKGRALSQVDIMAAALARHLKLTILTSDQDFAALPEIRTENWLA